MKISDLQVLSEYLWKQEVENFELAVIIAFDKHFYKPEMNYSDDEIEDAYIKVKYHLKEELEDKPFFDLIYDDTFDYYTKVILPDQLIDALHNSGKRIKNTARK